MSDKQTVNINAEYLHKDIDEVDTSEMTDEELEKYIDENFGYIDEDLSNKHY